MADSSPCDRDLYEQWQRLHEHRHAAEAESLRVARDEVNRRLTEMNQFRDQIEKERAAYVLRDWYEREIAILRGSIDDRVSLVDGRLKILENNASNWQGRWWAVGAIVALALAVGGLLMRLVR